MTVERDDEKMSADWSERVKAEKPQLEAERGREGWMDGQMEGGRERGMIDGWRAGGMGTS